MLLVNWIQIVAKAVSGSRLEKGQLLHIRALIANDLTERKVFSGLGYGRMEFALLTPRIVKSCLQP